MSVLAADLSTLYRARRGTVALVDVPLLFVLAVDGRGGPLGPAFAEAARSLRAVSCCAQVLAARLGYATRVMPLEALWSLPAPLAEAGDPEAWTWTARIVQPEPIDEAVVVEAGEQAVYRTGVLPLEVRRETVVEGLSAQTLHVGPSADEGRTIALLHERIAAQGLRPRGRHHEIYLDDPFAGDPDRLRTILRQPVERG